MDNKDSCLVVFDDFVLTYFTCPSHKVYYVSSSDDSIYCTSNRLSASTFVSRASALIVVDKLKNQFDIDFNIERLV